MCSIHPFACLLPSPSGTRLTISTTQQNPPSAGSNASRHSHIVAHVPVPGMLVIVLTDVRHPPPPPFVSRPQKKAPHASPRILPPGRSTVLMPVLCTKSSGSLMARCVREGGRAGRQKTCRPCVVPIPCVRARRVHTLGCLHLAT